jgi:hypothetical protein
MRTALNSAGTADHPGRLTCGGVSAHNGVVETIMETIWRSYGDNVKGELTALGWIGVYSQRRKRYGGLTFQQAERPI